MTLNIIIGNDSEITLKRMEQYVNKFIMGNKLDAKILLSTQNTEKVLYYSKNHFREINIYILDITHSDDTNIIGMARFIRKNEPHAYIILISSYIQYAFATFKYKLKIFDFLIKPVLYEDIEETMKALIEDYNRLKTCNLQLKEKSIKVMHDYREKEILLNEIIYIEAFGPKIVIHMKETSIETYYNMKEMESTLSKMSKSFYRIHKSYIINLNHIKGIYFKENTIIMSNGHKCYLSRNKKKIFKKELGCKSL